MDALDNSNLFIRSLELRDDIESKKFEYFPLNINALRNFVSMRFTTPVTIFNGENGCGKSTLIEAIAAHLGIPVMGGNYTLSATIERYDHGEEEESILKQYLFCAKGFRKPKRTFFFRAESFYKLADIISHDSSRSEFGLNSSSYSDVGLFEQSHGESFMDFLSHQLMPNGLYILDEPEAALAPQNQLKLMVMIDDLAKQGAQFIIATHSPFLLGYRDARIINLDNGMKEISFKQTAVYNLYRHFINNPSGYQKELFDEISLSSISHKKEKTDIENDSKLSIEAKEVLLYFQRVPTEGWVIAQAADKYHLSKTYELIKKNPNITQDELVKELDLEVW